MLGLAVKTHSDVEKAKTELAEQSKVTFLQVDADMDKTKAKIDEVMEVVKTMGSANIIGKFDELERAVEKLRQDMPPKADPFTKPAEDGTASTTLTEHAKKIDWLHDTMTGMLGGSAELLTDHRDQRRLLLDHPELLTDAVEELLRLTSPVQNLARTTTRDVEIRDVTIPAGEKVLLLYGSANRDERAFGDNADEFDVRRDIDKMLSLGYGAHHCLGASAARLQARVALDRLLDRFPDFEVDAPAGRFAPGGFVRRYESLPFTT